MKFFYTLLFAIICSVQLFAQQHPASIITGYFRGVSRQLKDIPANEILPSARLGREEGNEDEDKINKRVKFTVDNPNAISVDGTLQHNVQEKNAVVPNLPNSISALGVTFDGNNQADNNSFGFGVNPPDPSMCVGPNHVVQMINSVHSVYNKAGTRLTGPVLFSSIAPGATDAGDPIVIYDQLADRWLLMQFSDVSSGKDRLIFCLSKTADPTGAYDVYYFNMPPDIFPDYPHVGIWNNSYVVTCHEFSAAAGTFLGQGYYALDRKKMLQGPGAVTMIRFQTYEGGYLPVSLEGLKTPDPSSDPIFFSWDADELGASNDRLTYHTTSLNFINPAASTISPVVFLNTASFDGRSPSASRSTIEQSGTASGLDAIADRMMSRIIYRRFDNSESIVYNYTVNVSGANPTNAATYQSSVRWGELTRPTTSSVWAIKQEGTIAPGTINGTTGTNRWMGSAGIDQRGNIAVAYSRSSSTTFPSLIYSERRTCDALGTMGAEQTFFAGTGSQTGGGNRWGDYTAIAIDPSNEDSLWFTGEYYSATSASTFKTRIGKFAITPCAAAPEVHFLKSGTPANEKDATVATVNTCVKYKDYPVTIAIDQAPSQPVNLTINTSGTATLGADYDLIGAIGLVLNATTLSVQFTVRVYDEGILEGDEILNLSYSMNVNGGNAVAAGYNQVHGFNIFDNEIDPASLSPATVYGTAATIFSDNFDATATGTLGSWTEIVKKGTTGSTNANHWVVSTNGGLGFTSKSMIISNNGGTTYAYSNISTGGGVDTVIAASPVIDLTNKGQVTVTFTYKCRGNLADLGMLMYSINGGANWFAMPAKYANITTATSTTVSLNTTVENIPNFKIGFAFIVDTLTVNNVPLGVDIVSVTAKPITYNIPIQSATDAATAPTQYLGPNQTINFIDPTTRLMMATVINNSTQDFGCTKVEVDRTGTSSVNFNSTNPIYQLASKTFKITPTNNNALAPYTIRLYYTEAEIAGWEAATGQSRTSLNIVKVAGNTIGAVTPATQGSFSYTAQPSPVTTAYAQGYYVEASFTGFSGFGIGINPFAALPIHLIDFVGYNYGTINKISWKVDNQINVKQYELERSFNGVDFEKITTLTAQNSSATLLTYTYADTRFKQGVNYYRLKTVENDNSSSYSSVIVIKIGKKQPGITVYPNPVSDKFFLTYVGDAATVNVQLYSSNGQLVYNASHVVANPITIATNNLPNGNYVVKVTDNKKSYEYKFVKQ